ncbi:MAG TPA: gamma-glutamylcyclotransferase [Burkholderiaceae bacterium]|nr:gamma-glutamylcyclotransferase [Burkholderiaceae bacterium]
MSSRIRHAPLAESDLAGSLAATLAHWDRREPLWVFAYASLIWHPELRFDRRVAARVHGYHRRLCLWSVEYRGTLARPGLVAGLDRGGSCNGILYRVPATDVPKEFGVLWRREMSLGQYTPRWLACRRIGTSRVVRALAFVIRHDASNYCERISEAELIDVLLQARGARGSNLEYLEHTVAALHAEGIGDPHLERLAAHARAARAARGETASARRSPRRLPP